MAETRLRSAPKKTLSRRIHFFEWSSDDEASKSACEFDPKTLIQLVDNLAWDADGRYLAIDDGHDFCVWTWGTKPYPRIALGTVRRADLPLVDRKGKLVPLRIAAQDGLAEQTHVVFFPNNIVGVEGNFYGPRISRLSGYVARRFKGVLPEIHFDMLLHRDALARFDRLREIRLADMSLSRQHLSVAERADPSLASLFRNALETTGSEEVQIVLTQGPRSRRPLSDMVRGFVRSLASDPNVHEEVDILRVRGVDSVSGRVEMQDLLQDQLVTSRQVVRRRPQDRAVDSRRMFEAIESGYGELKSLLEGAARLR